MTSEISERLVESLATAYGTHPGYRAAHAKGVLCAATFTPTPAAATLSRAPHFEGGQVTAHVRFSNGSGDPTVSDSARDGRGLAVKFSLPDGSTTDLVAISLPVFFARNPEDLLEFNAARRPDPETGAPDVAKVGEYLGRDPEAVAAVTAAVTHVIPASYATLTYHGIHAFAFADATGAVRHGRYHVVPAAGEHALTEDEAAAAAPDYLRDELAQRLDAGPVIFTLLVEVAEAGDPVDDPTAVWPEGREQVELGRLEVTALAFDRERDGDILVFDPTRLPDGISPTNDAILLARSDAYRVSVTRRTAARAQ
jgi:catalase